MLGKSRKDVIGKFGNENDYMALPLSHTRGRRRGEAVLLQDHYGVGLKPSDNGRGRANWNARWSVYRARYGQEHKVVRDAS